MKRFFIMPFFVLFMTGATSNGVKPQPVAEQQATPSNIPISVKVDSVNAKMKEMDLLIKERL